MENDKDIDLELQKEEKIEEAWAPISQETFTEEDTRETTKIYELLDKEYGLFESEARSHLRQEVLGKLNKILQKWIYEAAISKGDDENTAARAGGRIFTFGSYSLGVHGPGTDIDTLCVAPRFVDRDKHFFGTLVDMLKNHPDIKDL